MKQFDAIIIGAGQAGPALAGRLTAAGMQVALVERNLVGGTCVNTGCTPTKALVASAHAAQMARRAADFGVVLSGDVRVDMQRVMGRARGIAETSRRGVRSWLEGMAGCTLIGGHAQFESSTIVCVGDERLTAPRIFLNVGGRAAITELPGVDATPFLTNSTILELDELPKHLVIIGGSYIGLEYAQMFRRFGAAVTVVEQGDRLIGREDPEISEAVAGILQNEGIAIRTSAPCIRVVPHAEGVQVTADCASGGSEIVGSHLLLAVGRRPNTDDLGLEKAGVATDERGFVTVDDALQSNVEGIWALGDCNGRGAFTHTAYNDFEILAANLLDGESRRVSDRVLGYALYIDPPLGRAGLTETQARAAGRKVLVGRRPMTRVSRAVEKGDPQGLMKAVVDAETNKILGAAILGPGGDEAIHGVLDVMSAGLDYRRLATTMPIHPTVSELIPTILGELQPPTDQRT